MFVHLLTTSGDVLLVHFLLEQALALRRAGLRVERRALLFELRELAVLQLGRLGVVAEALRPFDLGAHLFDLLADLAASAGSLPSPAPSAWRARFPAP